MVDDFSTKGPLRDLPLCLGLRKRLVDGLVKWLKNSQINIKNNACNLLFLNIYTHFITQLNWHLFSYFLYPAQGIFQNFSSIFKNLATFSVLGVFINDRV